MYGIKYRPMNFGSVIGAEAAKRVLSSILSAQEYDNGYLFSGPWGVGKTTLARIFARSILCENRTEDMSPCNECASCRTFLEDRNPSYLEIDAAGNGNKEDIEHLLSSLSFENMSGRRIVLLDESHNISAAGKDALLKVLEKEDGNDNVIFIFCTTEFEKMPETLRSRCMTFRLVSPSKRQVVEKLEAICRSEEIAYDKPSLGMIAEYADGHYRDAENALRNIARLGGVNPQNVGDVLSVYTLEVCDMLLNLRYDLKEALSLGDELLSKSSIESVYKSALRLLVDAMGVRMATSEPNTDYDKLCKDISDTYEGALVGVMDYLLNKDKLSDRTIFQSDMILIHYRFISGDFSTGADRKIQENAKAKSSPAPGTAESSGLRSLSSWERIEKAREIKAAKRTKSRDKSVVEKISGQWGAPKKDPSGSVTLSRDVDPSKFGDVTRSSKRERV